MKVVDVNAHLHTPYSFSAFTDVKQALDMAAQEGVKVVGINDFYSTDGYLEWREECGLRRLFPLFNIEFISLNAEDQVLCCGRFRIETRQVIIPFTAGIYDLRYST